MPNPPPNPPPNLTAQQRAAALDRAKQARKVRADAKKELSQGRKTIFDLINSVNPDIRKMRVREMLESVPGVGKARAALLMQKLSISPTRRIAGLGVHQVLGLKGEISMTKVEPVRGTLMVMSGPSGVGKSTITHELKKDPRFWISISATTREIRDGEKDGIDYHFFSDEKFDEMVGGNQFLEWAEFAGNRYGTPKEPIENWLALGKHVLLEIEIKGARQVRNQMPEALLVFIDPPSREELRKRLTSRGTDSPERQAARLALAEAEMAASGEFDYCIVNHEVSEVSRRLVSLALEHCKERFTL